MIFPPVRTIPACFIIVLVSISLFSSCSKNDQNLKTAEESCLLDSVLTSRTKNGVITHLQKTLYTYDEKNRWTKSQWYYEGKFGGHQQFTYEGDGKVSTLTNFDADGKKKDERKVFYDQQGRVGGFNLTTFDPYVSPLQKVTFAYEENKMIVVGWAGGDTLFKTIRFFENGNEVRAERWSGNTLQGIDSTSYTSQPYKNKFDADLSLVQSTMILHKNLIARRKVYNSILKVYEQDDSYAYEFTAEGIVKKITTSTNFPIPNAVPTVMEYIHRCK